MQYRNYTFITTKSTNIFLKVAIMFFRSRMIDSAPTPITRGVFMINMIKYVYNKIDDKKKIDIQFNIFDILFSFLDDTNSTRP